MLKPRLELRVVGLMSHDAFTKARWQSLWTEAEPSYDPERDPQLRDSLDLILRFWPDPQGRFLEAGCGTAANALNLARLGVAVAGVDLSLEGLERARAAFAERGLVGEFVEGDVRDLPFAEASFDFVYAGGVVEHFAETDRAVTEMVRVLRPGGRVLLTVPALTLSYPYLFLRGNVPAVPGLERALSLVQFRLLGGRLATFGYERSFLRRTLRSLLRTARLLDVELGRFDTYLPLLPVPRAVRGYARRLARTDLFAPMYFGTGTRPPD
jgi:SAM-dependent methyltransferase